MFSNIPKQRAILYLLIAGLLPVIFAAANLYTKKSSVDALQEHLVNITESAAIRNQKQSLNMIVSEYFKGADHFYFDKHLETLTFLKPEIKTLQKLVNNKYFAGDEIVKKRLEFLISPNNALLFSEGNVQAYPHFQETTATMQHSVEINLEDLKHILTLIEGVPIGPFEPGPDRPQLIIIDYKIDKKEATDKNDVYILNLKVLKREYT